MGVITDFNHDSWLIKNRQRWSEGWNELQALTHFRSPVEKPEWRSIQFLFSKQTLFNPWSRVFIPPGGQELAGSSFPAGSLVDLQLCRLSICSSLLAQLPSQHNASDICTESPERLRIGICDSCWLRWSLAVPLNHMMIDLILTEF